MGLSRFQLVVATVAIPACVALTVISPPDIAGEMPHDTALFGRIPYGTSITGILVYPPALPSMTGYSPYACEPYSDAQKDAIAKAFGGTGGTKTTPVIFLVERGNGCTFAHKARDAQAAGADAVVIFDNKEEAFTHLYMADDKKSPPVVIPSVFINHDNGLRLMNATQMAADPNGDAPNVMIQVSWKLPSPDNHVEWELWTSSNDTRSATFKKEFAPVARKLEASGKATFTPHLIVVDGDDFKCQQKCKSNPSCTATGYLCGLQCTNNGQYCAPDPEKDLESGMDGSDVVQENVRQMCIHRVLTAASQATGVPQTYRWWDYVVLFDELCSHADRSFNQVCSETQQQAAGVDVAAVRACVSGSGGTDVNSSSVNTLIEAEMQNRSAAGIFVYPTVVVNRKNLAGDYKIGCEPPINVRACGPLAAICDGFEEGTKPDLCSPSYCWEGTDACGVCKGDNSTCADCAGIPNGNTGRDCFFVCGGNATLDECGFCLNAGNANRNQCPANAARNMTGGNSVGGSSTVVYGVVFGCVGVLLVVAAVFTRRWQASREARLKREFQDMLSNYAPLEHANQQVGRPKSKLAKVGNKVGKGLQRLAGKRSAQNPIVQSAAADADEEGDWAGADGGQIELSTISDEPARADL
eukprot:g1616.t1